MAALPTESFNDTDINGEPLIMDVFGEPGDVSKLTIGNRFCVAVKCHPNNNSNPELTQWFIDYYRSYAILLSWSELKSGWHSYLKAKRMKTGQLNSNFWNCLDVIS